MRKAKLISKTTTNRGTFNRAHKHDLEHSGNIKCSYCQYHKNENYEGNFYGSYDDKNIKYPNWKLVSKNKKQWQDKPIKIIETKSKHSNSFILTKIKF